MAESSAPGDRKSTPDATRNGLVVDEGTELNTKQLTAYAEAGYGDATGAKLNGKVNAKKSIVSLVVDEKANGRNLVGTKVGENGEVRTETLISAVDRGKNNTIQTQWN